MSRLAAYVRQFTGFSRDGKLFLLFTLAAGAATSLYWVDFNLYLAALGVQPSTIGIIATAGSAAGALIAFPASALSDRVGRRLIMAGGVVLTAAALAGFLVLEAVPALILLGAVYGAGLQAAFVVQVPFMTEHTTRDNRSEYFSLQFAITNVTTVLAALLGGVLAGFVAGLLGAGPNSLEAYRFLIVLMLVLTLVSLVIVATLGDDRPSILLRERPRQVGEPAAFPRVSRRPLSPVRLIIVHDRGRFIRLLLPVFLVSLGAGQVIPFLNLFVQVKFGLDLAALNAVFALTSLGTTVAILLQPALARRYGKVNSVVLVQAVSIPFIVVLGFSPILWTVVLSMAVRNSLMNAGNPIANAFAMEHVDPAERASLAAATNLAWSAAWVIAGPYYSVLQATLGFELGYTVNFITIIVLYSVATGLYWRWFHRAEERPTTVAIPA